MRLTKEQRIILAAVRPIAAAQGFDASIEGARRGRHRKIRFRGRGQSFWMSVSTSPQNADVAIRLAIAQAKKLIRQHATRELAA